MLASDLSLRITEIFCSLQGESSWVGERTVFIRLTGCPLRCTYCDSAYTFKGGKKYTLSEICDVVAQFNVRFICVTGGEPLAQPAVLDLMSMLCNEEYQVSLETSGALDISVVDSRVKRVMDIKTPSSCEADKNLLENIEYISSKDEIKFCIASLEDYLWSLDFVRQHQLQDKTSNILFSPIFEVESSEENGISGCRGLNPKALAEWILEDQLNVRMQIQMHKFLWGDQPGH